MIRSMITHALLLCLALALPSAAYAQRATLPTVQDAAGNSIMTQGVICVNLAGAYTGCGGGSGASATQVQGTAADGAAPTGNPVLVAGSDGANAHTVMTGTDGRLQTSLYAGTVALTGLATQADGLGANSSLSALRVGSYGLVYNGATFDRQRGDTTGTYTVGKGTSSLATGQISVGTSSTLVAAARTGRAKIIVSVGAANTCAFGNTGVTTTTGFPLQPTAGASLTLDTGAALYAACSATTTVSFIEQF